MRLSKPLVAHWGETDVPIWRVGKGRAGGEKTILRVKWTREGRGKKRE